MSLHQFPRLSVSIFNPDRLSRQKALLAATAMSILVCSGARAADGDANEALLKKLEMMEQRIQSLEAELKKKQTSAPEKQTAPADKPTASSEKMPKKAPAPDPKKTPTPWYRRTHRRTHEASRRQRPNHSMFRDNRL